MTLPTLSNRDNLVERHSEAWRPPIFQTPSTTRAALLAFARRFFDLQASSIWNDLKRLLASCEGAVLDVGCGAQPYRSLLPRSVRYTGIDTIDARSRFGYEVPETIYFQGNTWPIDSGCMDTVIATETLEHVARPDEFLAEVRRVLKPDGWMILTVPFAARWHFIPYDYWRFTPAGLRTVLTGSGFAIPVVYARGNAVTVACYKVMALILMLLLGEYPSVLFRLVSRLTGCLLLPLLIGLAIVGRISLRSRGGNDSLGYTVVVAMTGASGGSA